MRKFVLDTNLFIAADRDPKAGEELIAFYDAFLPFTYFHAVVAQELLLGARDARRGAEIRRAYIAPFEARRRVVTPTFAAWARSGEVVATLIRQKHVSVAGFTRSFLNDVLLAVSCREVGAILVTHNLTDFDRIRRVERFEFVGPWPIP
ncbi:MAG: type II toxin-antitoxin system VapC family toxin [Gemmatimonadaceae bacterium]